MILLNQQLQLVGLHVAAPQHHRMSFYHTTPTGKYIVVYLCIYIMVYLTSSDDSSVAPNNDDAGLLPPAGINFNVACNCNLLTK